MAGWVGWLVGGWVLVWEGGSTGRHAGRQACMQADRRAGWRAGMQAVEMRVAVRSQRRHSVSVFVPHAMGLIVQSIETEHTGSRCVEVAGAICLSILFLCL